QSRSTNVNSGIHRLTISNHESRALPSSALQPISAARHDLRVAGIAGSRLRIGAIQLTTHHGRWRGWAVGRDLGAGLGDEWSQLGAHKPPSLKSPRIPAKGAASRGRRYPSPIGGTTRSPIRASASANVCWTQLPSAPLAMFSFAAISW